LGLLKDPRSVIRRIWFQHAETPYRFTMQAHS